MEETQETQVTIDDIPRHEPENPLGYSKVELAKRKKALRDMEKDYPSLPFGWLEMTYDFCATRPESEIEQIINDGLFEAPGKFSIAKAYQEAIKHTTKTSENKI
jgi:hypothetical protein